MTENSGAIHQLSVCFDSNSELELEERSRLKDLLCGLTVISINEFFQWVWSEFLSIDDFKHALVLLDLAVLRINREEYFYSPFLLRKIAQVHESALCEKDKISIAKLDVEIIRHFIKKARELMEGFWAK